MVFRKGDKKMDKETKQAMDEVLAFSSKAITISFFDEKPTKEEFEFVRRQCDILKSNGVYDFDTNCTDVQLLQQIHSFADTGI